MTNVFPLIPQQQKIVDDFIQKGRNLTILKKNGITFDDKTWDLSKFTKTANNRNNQTISFKTVRDGRHKAAPQFPEPFNGVAKAYIALYLKVHLQSGLSIGPFRKRLRAFQRLEQQLFEAGMAGDIASLTREHAVAAIESCESPSTLGDLAYTVNEICRGLYDADVCPDAPQNIEPAQYNINRFSRNKTREEKKKDDEKPLTDEEAFAIAEAFYKAGEIGSPSDKLTKRNKLTTSILALMFCAPCRIEEATILPFDVEVEEGTNRPVDDTVSFDQQENYRFALRWWPVKGGPVQIKFVVAEMAEVAKEAIERLRELSEDGRALAKKISRTNQIPLPDGLEHLRQTGEVTRAEFCKILGLSTLKPYIRNQLVSVRWGVYTFASVEAYWRSLLPKGWPMVSDHSGVEYKDCLTTHLLHAYEDGKKSPSPCVPTCITPQTIIQDIKGQLVNGKYWYPSVFERLDVRLPDGTYPEITTHKIRHYLNTIAQKANVPQALIAHWSGRANVMQNEVYDHTDKEAVVQAILDKKSREANEINNELKLPTIVDDSPDNAAYREALVRQSIHSTPFGFCVRNLRINPCQRAVECAACTSLVCIAGDKRHMKSFEEDLGRREQALKNIKEIEESGGRVNPVVKEAMEEQYEYVSQLTDLLHDEKNLGQWFRHPDAGKGLEFSHDKRRIDEMKKLEAKK